MQHLIGKEQRLRIATGGGGAWILLSIFLLHMSVSILAVRVASGSEAGFLPAVVATLPMCKDQLLLLCLLQLSQFSWAYLYSKELLLLLFFVEWSRGRRTNVISYIL